jgi:hypothetical protein
MNEHVIYAFIDELEKIANNFGMLPPMIDDHSFYQPPIASSQQVATDNKKLNANTQYISNTSSAKVKGNAKYY